MWVGYTTRIQDALRTWWSDFVYTDALYVQIRKWYKQYRVEMPSVSGNVNDKLHIRMTPEQWEQFDDRYKDTAFFAATGIDYRVLGGILVQITTDPNETGLYVSDRRIGGPFTSENS